MKLLACWPIPEVFACLVITAIAGHIVQEFPAAMMLGAILGISVASIGSYVRDRYNTEG